MKRRHVVHARTIIRLRVGASDYGSGEGDELTLIL